MQKICSKLKILWQNSAFRNAILSVAFLRLFTGLLMLFFSQINPIDTCPHNWCSQTEYDLLFNSTGFSNASLSPWYRWDAVHYVDIAQYGYTLQNVENTVWPPVFPSLIRFFSLLILPVSAALLASTLALFTAFYYLHKLICKYWNEQIATGTIWILAIFPTSFFFVAPYTESLFLLFVVLFFFNLDRKHWLIAGCFASLATLTRHQGIFLVPVLLLAVWLHWRKNKSLSTANILRAGTASLLPLISFGANMLYIRFIVGAPWPWETLSGYWTLHFDFPWQGLIGNTRFLFEQPNLFYIPSNILDSILFILFLVLIFSKDGRKNPVFLLYSLFMFLPALKIRTDWFTLVSVSRYVLVIFPAAIALSAWLQNRKRLQWVLAGVSLLLQCGCLYLYYNWIWVA